MRISYTTLTTLATLGVLSMIFEWPKPSSFPRLSIAHWEQNWSKFYPVPYSKITWTGTMEKKSMRNQPDKYFKAICFLSMISSYYSFSGILVKNDMTISTKNMKSMTKKLMHQAYPSY